MDNLWIIGILYVLANKKRYHNIFVPSDTQAPFHHPATIEFFQYVYKLFKCKEAIHPGDEWDFKYLNRNGMMWNDPDEKFTPTDEYRKALAFLKELRSKIPIKKICHSNHSARIWKRAKEAYIPSFLVKSYKEIIQVPNDVIVARRFVEYGGQVVVEHGDRCGNGVNAAIKLAISNRVSTVIGHHSASGGILYNSTLRPTASGDKREQIFGMNVGGMVDEKSYGMAWAKDFMNRTTLGCGVLVWDNQRKLVIPHFIPYD